MLRCEGTLFQLKYEWYEIQENAFWAESSTKEGGLHDPCKCCDTLFTLVPSLCMSVMISFVKCATHFCVILHLSERYFKYLLTDAMKINRYPDRAPSSRTHPGFVVEVTPT